VRENHPQCSVLLSQLPPLCPWLLQLSLHFLYPTACQKASLSHLLPVTKFQQSASASNVISAIKSAMRTRTAIWHDFIFAPVKRRSEFIITLVVENCSVCITYLFTSTIQFVQNRKIYICVLIAFKIDYTDDSIKHYLIKLVCARYI
jgi:hypothetical protein